MKKGFNVPRVTILEYSPVRNCVLKKKYTTHLRVILLN